MKNILWLICLFCTIEIYGKEYHLNFNQGTPLISADRLVQGIAGQSLDLSETAYNRYGIEIASIDSTDVSHSFSVFLWVKSSANYLGSKALVTNKKTLEINDKGFFIGTQDNGSWMVSFCDGIMHGNINQPRNVNLSMMEDGIKLALHMTQISRKCVCIMMVKT